MKSKFILGLILLLSVSIPGYGQTIEDIKQQVKSELESKYGISFLVDVDTFDGGDAYTYQDPYNTLSGTYLVMASGSASDKDLIGVYKDGALLWNTEPELTGSTYRHFLGSRELNSDGKVELIFGWKLGVNPRGSFLWIISWDGSNGKIINKIDERGRPEIYAGGDVIFYPDFEGDGIYEIMTYDFYDETFDRDILINTKWDGLNYSIIERTPEDALSLTDYVRNQLSVKNKGVVRKESSELIFNYSFINDSSSIQSISDIYLDNEFGSLIEKSLPKRFRILTTKYGYLWLMIAAENEAKYSTLPAKELSFSFKTRSLLRINAFYVQGFNDFYAQASLNASDEERIADIKTNSVSGYTLGPWLPDSSLSLEAFTDTLETFRYRSCEELGWTTDAGVCGELEEDLSAIKTHLQAGDSTGAANALAEFLELVEQEKEASLTSEGYALLFFNAEYLAQRLPAPQEPEIGSGITCGCENPVTQSSGTITLRNDETKCLSQPFSGSVFFESGGTLNVCSAASFQNVYGNQPGQINVSETGEVTVGNWNNNATGDAFTNWGTTTFTNWMTINNGTLTNHGQMSVNGGLNQNNGLLVNTGTLEVSNAITFNNTGNRNEGSLFVGSSLTLNSNAGLENTCQVETTGQLMINGALQTGEGSLLQAGFTTINSGGVLTLSGANVMVSIEGGMLNGTINAEGSNQLLISRQNLTYNSGASITSSSETLHVVAPNFSALSTSFSISEGSDAVIPVTRCNIIGYNN